MYQKICNNIDPKYFKEDTWSFGIPNITAQVL